MLRFFDKLFKLSRIFKASPGFRKYLSYKPYGEGVAGWLGFYTWRNRCIAFMRDDEQIIWLHEAR